MIRNMYLQGQLQLANVQTHFVEEFSRQWGEIVARLSRQVVEHPHGRQRVPTHHLVAFPDETTQSKKQK